MPDQQVKRAYFAGGCFWGMEELFRKLPGVVDTEVGYMGGTHASPTYESHTGHAEALEITYNPSEITYRELLDFFFRIHDPTTKDRQGNDVGTSYRSAIFYQTAEEERESKDVIQLVNDSGRWDSPVVTTLEGNATFYPAEDYHQDYLKQKPNGYTCHYVRFDSYLSER